MPNYQRMQLDNEKNSHQVYRLDIKTIKTITLKNVKSAVLDVIVILSAFFILSLV
jgi:hypothetical protein